VYKRPDLLAALKRCVSPEGLDAARYDEFDYVHLFGRAQQALLLAAIFVPKFIEFQGSVFLAQAAREGSLGHFQASIASSSMTLEALEASFNRIEVPYLFPTSGQDVPDSEWTVLAELIAQSWRAHLAINYPSRSFMVSVAPAAGEEEITVGFFEVRSPSNADLVG